MLQLLQRPLLLLTALLLPVLVKAHPVDCGPYVNYTDYSPFSNPIHYTCIERSVDTLINLDKEHRQVFRSIERAQIQKLRRIILKHECIRREI